MVRTEETHLRDGANCVNHCSTMKGLLNLGNTCYINTAIQCLVTVPDFVRFILGLPRRSDDPMIESLIDLVTSIVNESDSERNPDGNQRVQAEAISPMRFVRELRRCMSLRVHDPNDIQEFLALFLDKLNSQMCRKLLPKEFFDAEFHGPLTTMQKMARVQWYKSIWDEYSPIKDIFYGLTVGQIRCANCSKLHHNYEVFSTIMLPAPSERTSLTRSIEMYFAEEPVADGWRCDGCNETSSSSARVVRMCRLPKTLTICIKRFAEQGPGARRKNSIAVDAPDILDIDPWSIGVTGLYELRAMACHSGDHQHGHYWGLMKNVLTPGATARWKKVDDAFVFDLGQTSIETPGEAYVFTYVLCAR